MRDLDVGTVYSRVFAVYASQFATLFGTALVVNLVTAVAAVVLPGTGGALAFSILALVLGTLYAGMVVRLVQDLEDGTRDASVRQLVAGAWPVVLPLIGVSFVTGIAIALGLVLLLVPGLFLLTIWAVVAPVTVVEDPGVFASMSRSQELVRGHGAAVFGVILVGLLLSLLAVSVAAAIGARIDSDAARFVLNWILPALAAPVTALVASVVYFTLRGETPAAWAPPTATPFG